MGNNLKMFSLKTSLMKMVSPTNFSCPRTPQQNNVVERKNRSLQEMIRTLISEFGTQNYFGAKAVSTTFYILNRVFIRKVLNMAPYELWKEGKPSVSYFHNFSCAFYISNNKENLGKFDEKSNKATFTGYSLSSKLWKKECMLFFYEHDKTLEKRNIEILEEELERIKANQHTYNIAPILGSPKKIVEEPSETPQKANMPKS